MKRRTIAALLACTMVIGTLAGCSSEPKNPGDSDTTVVGQLQSSPVRRRLTEHMSEKEVENQMVK